MSDQPSIPELTEALRVFAEERDWDCVLEMPTEKLDQMRMHRSQRIARASQITQPGPAKPYRGRVTADQSGAEWDVDERVLKLAGEASSLLRTAPRSTVDLDPSEIEAALSRGMTCVARTLGKRILIYKWEDRVDAVITILAHAGYRRKFKRVSGANPSEVVALIEKTGT